MRTTFQTRHTLLQRACQLDDEKAWEEFVGQYRAFIAHVLGKLGVEREAIDDLTQQVLIALTRDLPGYDRTKASFRTWLAVVVRNKAYSHFRKRTASQRRLHEFADQAHCQTHWQPPQVAPTIERIIDDEWATYLATLAMARVKEVFQGQALTVFDLSLDGLPAATIAEKTGLSIASVYTLRKRVKKRLYLEIRALAAELEP
ncbi:RNA polymerase sigma factor [Roseibacillus ishigakijimensis]|nr:sigma-70 family RNA polymerase sigma factor [Roseibacillus ishigakijimensis]